jgi:OCT family organic cation transporter-like MFS transporter 18
MGKEERDEPTGKSSDLRRRMSIVMYTVVFLYAAAFWIQTGVLPVSTTDSTPSLHLLRPLQFLSKKLGADPVIFGYMQTVFAVAMLLGGPLFGRFGDIFGARAALLLAFLSCLLTYLILSFANGLPALFFSRIFAFMMHVMHGM